MNARFLSALVLVFLFGAAAYLWLKPANPPPPATEQTGSSTSAPVPPGTPAAPEQFLILAASWQPAFCETTRNKPECSTLGRTRFDATHFALHGLWPQKQYCGVSSSVRQRDEEGRWSALPAVELAPETRSVLDEVMPGTRSQLERHEWIKHGTCYSDSPGPYFATAVLLLSALNSSVVRDLFADSIGKTLSLAEIRGAFDAAYGPGAGKRVRVACEDDGRRRLISELTIGLYGAPGATPNLRELIMAANPTDGGCEGGIVDPAGFQ